MSSEEAPSISSLITEFLDQPPSCLEFCPQDPDYFVVGTYLLHEEKPEQKQQQHGDQNASSTSTTKQTKTGTLQLWHLDATTPQLKQKQVVTLSHAVFDLHFHPRQSTLLGIAGSDGTVSLYNVFSSSFHPDRLNYPHIEHIWTRSVHEEENPGSIIPALYLAWFPQRWFPTTSSSYLDGFAVTFSDGRTSVFSTPLLAAAAAAQQGEGGQYYDIAKGNGFDLVETQFEPRDGVAIETWFVALASYREEAAAAADDSSKKASSFIFTGDDFGSLNIRKFRAPDEEDEDETGTGLSLEDCMISNTSDGARHHTAGVTAILPLPIVNVVENAPILLTGSYDEYIRVYHANSRRGAILAERRLGGGVWRLQIINTEEIMEEADVGEVNFLVLASCMHAGTRVVKVTWKRKQAPEVGDWDIQVLAQFTEHESMNYASGFWKGNKSTSHLLCVSSSFYDKRLCLWKLQI